MTLEELRNELRTDLRRIEDKVDELALRGIAIETTMAEKVNAADNRHSAIEAACAARHASSNARLGRLEKGALGMLLAVFAAVGSMAWSKLTGERP